MSYKVDAARVGQRTDYDRLTLEVETNGALDPRGVHDQGGRSADPAAGHIRRGDRLREKMAATASARTANGTATKGSHLDDILIEELELGVRSYNCLKREGVETVGDLVNKSEQELMCIPNFGRKSIDEVRERLDEQSEAKGRIA